MCKSAKTSADRRKGHRDRQGAESRRADTNRITDEIAVGNYLKARDMNLLTLGRFRFGLCPDGSLSKTDREELNLEEIVVIELKDWPGNDPHSFRKAVKSLIKSVEDFPPSSCNVTSVGVGR